MQFPLMHLNGSGKQNLLPPVNVIVERLREALREMQESRPHMRDYYPLQAEGNAFARAQQEHELLVDMTAATLRHFERMQWFVAHVEEIPGHEERGDLAESMHTGTEPSDVLSPTAVARVRATLADFDAGNLTPKGLRQRLTQAIAVELVDS